MKAVAVSERLWTALATILLGGLLGATLVRIGPGFGTDERELDARLGADSLAALRNSKAGRGNLLKYYGTYLAALAHGDLGVSDSLNQPVRDLLRDRWPVTARSAGLGLALGWLAGLVLAVAAQFLRLPGFDPAAGLLSALFLSMPAAVLAIVFVRWRAPAALAIAAVVFPRVFRYARNLVLSARGQPHVTMAVAKGLSPNRVMLWHVLPQVAPQMVSLLGVSLNLALTAAIPIEALCDVPGIGQLAWQAALARDLPVLVSITLVLAGLTLAANLASEWIIEAFPALRSNDRAALAGPA